MSPMDQRRNSSSRGSAAEASETGAGEEGGARKRRKVGVACKPCRVKKIRCSGGRPRCSSCAAKQLECEYEEPAAPVLVGDLADLETRLRKVLDRYSEPSAGPPPVAVSRRPRSRSPGLGLGAGMGSKDADLATQDRPHSGLFYLDPNQPRAEDGAPYAGSSTAEFVRDVTLITGSAPQESRGPGATTAYTSASSVPRLSDDWPVETDLLSMVVPERGMADELVNCFTRHTHLLFPILHIPSFRQHYERLWSPAEDTSSSSSSHGGGTSSSGSSTVVQQTHVQAQKPMRSGWDGGLAEKAIFHATLNMVFALGVPTCARVEQTAKLRTAERFYQRARVLVPLDALDIISLEVVQMLLVTTVYLHCSRYANRCWNTLGLALRVAQALGLQFDDDAVLGYRRPRSQLQRQMRLRTWHNCLVLDKLVCGTFGRASLLPLERTPSVPMPDCIDDEYLLQDGVGVQPPGVPSLIDAFVLSIRVFDVMSDTFLCHWSHYRGRPPQYTMPLETSESLGRLMEVLRLNEKLDEIEHNTPPHLRRHPDTSPSPRTSRVDALQMQAEILATRIMLARLIVLRPVLLSAVRLALSPTNTSSQLHSSSPSANATSTPGSTNAATNNPTGSTPTASSASRTEASLRCEISALCAGTARRAISLLAHSLDNGRALPGWNAAFIALSAATVLVAARLPGLSEDHHDRHHKRVQGEGRRSGNGNGGGESGGESGDEGDDESDEMLLAKARRILDEHRWRVQAAGGASEVLERFARAVEGAAARQKQQQQQQQQNPRAETPPSGGGSGVEKTAREGRQGEQGNVPSVQGTAGSGGISGSISGSQQRWLAPPPGPQHHLAHGPGGVSAYGAGAPDPAGHQQYQHHQPYAPDGSMAIPVDPLGQMQPLDDPAIAAATATGFDFTDPLLNFQWDGLTPGNFNMQWAGFDWSTPAPVL